MARYQSRHALLSSEPADPRKRHRLVLVRVGLALVLVGAALVVGSVFETRSPLKGRMAADVHGSANAEASSTTTTTARGASGGAGTASPGGHRPKGTSTGTGGTAGTGSTPHTRARHGHPPAASVPQVPNPSAPAQLLVTPAGFGPLLRHLWVAADPGRVGLTAADVRSTVAGTVYYAGQPSAGQYWAMARFWPTAAALDSASTPTGRRLLAAFQDEAVFYRGPHQAWSYVGAYALDQCPSQVPGVVLQAWGICTVGS